MSDEPDADALPTLALFADGDAEVLVEAIQEHYEFVPSKEYCRDLLAFIEKLTSDKNEHLC